MASGLRTPFARALGLVASIAASVVLVATSWAAPEKVAGGIRFTYRDPNAGAVDWAGAFNDWNATSKPMKKDDNGVWSIVLALPAGDQPYKLVVDGQWFADPENPVTVGEFGNSVVKVGPDGGLVTQTATANTAYSPKITISGRTHSLMEEIFATERSRYEMTRPVFSIDLGFGIRISDLMTAKILTNIDPQKEDVQDYRSRLNWQRGSLDFRQPDLRVFAFDSETLSTWDDPAHLVGNVGVYRHPFGFQQQGFLVTTPKYGFDTQVLYSDNSTPGGTEFPAGNGTVFDDFKIDRGTNRVFDFDVNAVNHSYQILKTARDATNQFRLIPGETAKITATDVGDGGGNFGFGDGATNVFAATVHRSLPFGARVGVLGRTDRGFHLGRLVKATVLDDSTGTIVYGQTEQQSFAGGGDVAWSPHAGVNTYVELLKGARRLDMMDRATQLGFHTISTSSPTISTVALTPQASPLGLHFNLDESTRLVAGGSWTFAQGDVGLFAEYEYQDHRYPSWMQPPLAPAGAANPDLAQFENVAFQRSVDVAPRMINNRMNELRLRWDRNWRYYLGREVRTSIAGEFTSFRYDRATSWQYQMWFPNGNFWLQQNGQVVSLDRLTSLGISHVYRLRPSLEVPIRRERDVVFKWFGTFTGTPPGLGKLTLKQPRYAESIFQFGADVNRRIRFTNDTRWAKYDAPALNLAHGYLSQFSELVYRFSDDIHVGLGLGLDPFVLDPVTNEFANIGRETYLGSLNANGYIAENNWTSLAPQIEAAERNLRALHRIQIEAVVRF